MNRTLRLLLSLGLGASMVLAPATVSAATVTYRLAGIEVRATTNQGTFAGAALATDDVALWKAVVDHSGLPALGGTSLITGGSFVMDGRLRDFAGAIAPGGTIAFTSADPNCGREFFAVGGQAIATNGATANFQVVLTHFRRVIGTCRTIFATVKGSVTFTLP